LASDKFYTEVNKYSEYIGKPITSIEIDDDLLFKILELTNDELEFTNDI
jgi:hypothetical protein